MTNPLEIDALVNAPLERVWALWNEPAHITKWNAASPEWHSPFAENDLREGGSFNYRMEAKDGSFGFDFAGTYSTVRPHEFIAYTLGDGRRAEIRFSSEGPQTRIRERFEAEGQNAADMQRAGWQAILDSFSAYAAQHA